MQAIHYVHSFVEVVGALGLLCSALSRIVPGKASTVLAHMGTNFIAAARSLKEEPPKSTTHITIPPKV